MSNNPTSSVLGKRARLDLSDKNTQNLYDEYTIHQIRRLLKDAKHCSPSGKQSIADHFYEYLDTFTPNSTLTPTLAPTGVEPAPMKELISVTVEAQEQRDSAQYVGPKELYDGELIRMFLHLPDKYTCPLRKRLDKEAIDEIEVEAEEAWKKFKNAAKQIEAGIPYFPAADERIVQSVVFMSWE